MASSADNTAAERTLIDRLQAQGLGQDLIGAVDAELKRKRRRQRTTARAAAAAAALLFAAFWGVPYYRETSTLATPPAERRSLELADGSRVELNAQTDLKTDFRYGRRHLRLDRGEIFLLVAKDPDHPFIVETPAGTVRVTGTEFNVRVGQSREVDVTLLEGSVLVQTGSAPAQPMQPGHAARLDGLTPALRALSPDELAQATAWRRGSIVLKGLTLSEVAERFATFHGKKIEVAPEAASLRLGGTYSLDNLAEFFEALKATDAVNVVQMDDATYRIVPATDQFPKNLDPGRE